MERVMSMLLNDFVTKPQTEVHLVLIGRKREVMFELDERIKIHKPLFTFDPNKKAWYTIKTLRFLRKKIKTLQPNTVLSFGEMWNNLVLLSLLNLKYPVFISDRSEPNKNLGTLHNWLRKRLYPKARGYIAQTQKAAEVAKKNNWNTNVTVIGNPIKPISSKSDIEKENIVLTVGRLIKTKHIDELINIFISCNEPNWKLVIVGGNAKRMNLLEDYREYVKKENIEDRVQLLGAQQNVDDYYSKSKLFAFTSSSEGFPNVIGEALAHGLPVVSYDCNAGPADMIEDGTNGFLVKTHDQDAFKEKLDLLIKNENLRNQFSINSPIKINRFSRDKIVEDFFKFITNP